MATLTFALIMNLCIGRSTAMQRTVLASPAFAQSNPPFSSAQLTERTKYRRAVEAALWGMPIVAVDAIRQGCFRAHESPRAASS
jgi:hypothetical protein